MVHNGVQNYYKVTFSEKLNFIENYHNFERTEDRATVFLKWTDFKKKFILLRW